MKGIKMFKKGESKVFWTLRFKKDGEIDIGECHGDGALHLWTSRKRAKEEADHFEEKALPTKIKITRVS